MSTVRFCSRFRVVPFFFLSICLCGGRALAQEAAKDAQAPTALEQARAELAETQVSLRAVLAERLQMAQALRKPTFDYVQAPGTQPDPEEKLGKELVALRQRLTEVEQERRDLRKEISALLLQDPEYRERQAKRESQVKRMTEIEVERRALIKKQRELALKVKSLELTEAAGGAGTGQPQNAASARDERTAK